MKWWSWDTPGAGINGGGDEVGGQGQLDCSPNEWAQGDACWPEASHRLSSQEGSRKAGDSHLVLGFETKSVFEFSGCTMRKTMIKTFTMSSALSHLTGSHV